MSIDTMVVERGGQRHLYYTKEVEDTGEIRPGIVRHASSGIMSIRLWAGFRRGVRHAKDHGVQATLIKAWARMARPYRKAPVVSDDATQFNGQQRLEDMDTPATPLPQYVTYGLPEQYPAIVPGWNRNSPDRGTRIIDRVGDDLTALVQAARQLPPYPANAEAHRPQGHQGKRRQGWREEAQERIQGAGYRHGSAVFSALRDPEWHQAARATAITVTMWAFTFMALGVFACGIKIAVGAAF